MNIDKRLDALETEIKPPSDKLPYAVVYQTVDGSYYDGNPGLAEDKRGKVITDAELEAIKAGCDDLIVVKYVNDWRGLNKRDVPMETLEK